MSMSQEDIEALMNGLDMPAQDSVETIKEEPIPEEKVNTDDFKITLASIENKNKNCAKISNKEKPIDKESYNKYNKELLETLKAGYGKKTNVFDNMTMQSLFENSIKKDLFRELL